MPVVAPGLVIKHSSPSQQSAFAVHGVLEPASIQQVPSHDRPPQQSVSCSHVAPGTTQQAPLSHVPPLQQSISFVHAVVVPAAAQQAPSVHVPELQSLPAVHSVPRDATHVDWPSAEVSHENPLQHPTEGEQGSCNGAHAWQT